MSQCDHDEHVDDLVADELGREWGVWRDGKAMGILLGVQVEKAPLLFALSEY